MTRTENGARVDVMSDTARLSRVIPALALAALLAGAGAAPAPG